MTCVYRREKKYKRNAKDFKKAWHDVTRPNGAASRAQRQLKPWKTLSDAHVSSTIGKKKKASSTKKRGARTGKQTMHRFSNIRTKVHHSHPKKKEEERHKRKRVHGENTKERDLLASLILFILSSTCRPAVPKRINTYPHIKSTKKKQQQQRKKKEGCKETHAKTIKLSNRGEGRDESAKRKRKRATYVKRHEEPASDVVVVFIVEELLSSSAFECVCVFLFHFCLLLVCTFLPSPPSTARLRNYNGSQNNNKKERKKRRSTQGAVTRTRISTAGSLFS